MNESASLPVDPRAAANEVAEAYAEQGAWLDEFVRQLDRRRSAGQLERVMRVWDLSQAEAGRLFGVSRQAVSKWRANGVPAERADALAQLAAATDLLERHLKGERIAGVVRRPAAALGDRSLLDLVASGDFAAVLDACREMFEWQRAHA